MNPKRTCGLGMAYLAQVTCPEQVQASSATSLATDWQSQNLWLQHAQHIAVAAATANSTVATTVTSCYTFAPADGAARFAVFASECYYN